MLDHVSLAVPDIARAKAFYDTALLPLGVVALWAEPAGEGSAPKVLGYGEAGTQKPYFWLAESGPVTARAHVAFVAKDRAQVDAFYAAAIAAGGRDNGKPGLRPQYHPNYYGAFVLDPAGLNIEAVCHSPG